MNRITDEQKRIEARRALAYGRAQANKMGPHDFHGAGHCARCDKIAARCRELDEKEGR